MEDEKEKLAKESIEGSFYLFLSSGVVKLSSLVFFYIIVNTIGPTESGIYSLILNFANLISVLADVGIGTSLLYYISFYRMKNDGEKIKRTLFSAFVILIFSSLAVITLASGIYFFGLVKMYDEVVEKWFFYVVLIGVLMIFFGSPVVILGTFKKFDKIFVANFFGSVVKIGVLLFFILNSKKDVESIFIATSASIIVPGVLALLFLKNELDRIGGNFGFLNLNEIKDMIKTSIKNFIINLNSYLSNIDIIILGFFSSPLVVGAYAVLIGMVRQIVGFFLGNFYYLMIIILSSKKEVDAELIKKYNSQAIKWITYILLPILATVLVFAKEIVKILFPPYTEFYWLIYFVSFISVISFFSIPSRSALIADKENKKIAESTTLGNIALVILGLLLTYHYDLVGLIISVFISVCLSEIIIIKYAIEKQKIELHPSIGKAFFVFIILILFLNAIKSILIPLQFYEKIFAYISLSIIGTGIFFLIIFKMGGFSSTDKKIFEEMKKKLDYLLPKF